MAGSKQLERALIGDYLAKPDTVAWRAWADRCEEAGDENGAHLWRGRAEMFEAVRRRFREAAAMEYYRHERLADEGCREAFVVRGARYEVDFYRSWLGVVYTICRVVDTGPRSVNKIILERSRIETQPSQDAERRHNRRLVEICDSIREFSEVGESSEQ